MSPRSHARRRSAARAQAAPPAAPLRQKTGAVLMLDRIVRRRRVHGRGGVLEIMGVERPDFLRGVIGRLGGGWICSRFHDGLRWTDRSFLARSGGGGCLLKSASRWRARWEFHIEKQYALIVFRKLSSFPMESQGAKSTIDGRRGRLTLCAASASRRRLRKIRPPC